MVLMKVSLDNVFGFEDFSLDFSYPKKIVNSTIEREHLEGFPNFRYKKAVIIMGGNATGKTSFGKALMAIFNFIAKKDIHLLSSSIGDVEKEASFLIDFVSDGILYKVGSRIRPSGNGEYSDENISVSLKKTRIGEKDSYENCSKVLSGSEGLEGSYLEVFREAFGLGWFFTFPDSEAVLRLSKIQDKDKFAATLDIVMRTLDSSIEKVSKSRELENSFIIKHGKKEIIIKDGQILNGSILSSGTINGIGIAYLLSSIMGHLNGFYYCDEKYSFIHSDLEKNLLAMMIYRLGENEQLFFTTHNPAVLDMNLPKHTFLFFRKERGRISVVSADSFLKRNTDCLRNAVENDLFSIAPDCDLLQELEKME